MFVTNPDDLTNAIECKKRMAKYLVSNGIKILSRDADVYYFDRTSKVEGLIKYAPFYIKLVERW